MSLPAHDAADAFLTGGGIASAFGKDDPIGTAITGTITEKPEVKQQTKMEDGTPLVWDNGDPKMQLVVTLQVDGIPVTDDETGLRRIYVKGSKTPGSKSMHDAVASAVRGAGARGLEVGGRITVQYIGDEPSKTRGYNDRKLWAASYAAPAPTATSADFLGTAPPAPAAVAAPAAPVATPVAQPVAAPAPVPAPAAPAVAPAPAMTPEMLAAFQAYQQQQAQQPA